MATKVSICDTCKWCRKYDKVRLCELESYPSDTKKRCRYYMKVVVKSG